MGSTEYQVLVTFTKGEENASAEPEMEHRVSAATYFLLLIQRLPKLISSIPPHYANRYIGVEFARLKGGQRMAVAFPCLIARHNDSFGG
jgi:hypothetical protein